MTPTEIRSALEQILPRVEKPGRYVGLEANLIRKDWQAVDATLLLLFPDEYGIGMSHLGTRILYHIANSRVDTLAERAFAPWPDMAAAMRAAAVPLYSLESYHAAADFDIIGITLQTELGYANIPYLLDLAGLPRWSHQRDERSPLIVGGGPCVANPEPLAEFFDVFAVGDGEVLLPTLLDAVKLAKSERLSRQELLRRLARIPGLYVPQLYRWTPRSHPAQGGTFQIIDDVAPAKVRRVFATVLNIADVPPIPIVPAVEVVQDRLGMEVARGCTHGCRFCQAGFWYRPVREHDPRTVFETLHAHVDATGCEEVGLLSLSAADYSQIEPLAQSLADSLAPRRVSVSLPSLRADAFSVALAESVSRVRKAGFTFAPETGSDRLRRVINKTFANADMISAAEVAFSHGWNLIKVYAMIGLPSETDNDLDELARLTEDLLAAARRVGNRRAEVKVAVGPFVPKSWTPFQWEPFVPVEEMNRRIALLRERFRHIRQAKLTWNDPREAALEALLARGDRRLAPVIARAHDLGAVFDGWGEWLRLDAWEQALAEARVEVADELGPRALDAELPWDIVDSGVGKGYLKAERQRAEAGTTTPDCRWDNCQHCGIPGNGADNRRGLANLSTPGRLTSTTSPTHASDHETDPDPAALSPLPTLMQPEHAVRIRFTFRKVADARWLSHRNTMDLLQRALRAAVVPVRYTEGFNPHIRLSMGPALALGAEGLVEYFDVDCFAPLEPGMLSRANRVLPEGLALTSCEPLPEGSPSLGKAVVACRFRLGPAPAQLTWPSSPDQLGEIRDGILDWRVEGGLVVTTLNSHQPSGALVSPKDVLRACGVPAEAMSCVRVVREAVLLGRRAE